MSYPASIDSIPQPTATSPTNNPSASGVSVAQTTAIVALETKLGTGASTPTSGTVLTGNGTGTSTWGTTTGSGNVVLATSPTLVTPALGTPASGVATNLTGTASGLTAGNVTTNANLTGPITSSGNTTSIASQTGTGSKFVVDTSPTIVTPTIVKNANPVMSLNGNPVWQYLGYAQVVANQATASTTYVQVTGLTLTVTIPAGNRCVKITGFMVPYNNSAGDGVLISIWDGAVGSGTQLSVGGYEKNSLTSAAGCIVMAIVQPAAGSKTYNIGFLSKLGGSANTNAVSVTPAFILVECC